MPYIVSNSDGSLTVTVADTTVDTTSYSLALVGRSVSNYGQYFAQNTIRQLENFASSVAPSPTNRLVGQLWYDKSEQLLRVWDGTIWKRATNIVVGNEEPTVNVTGGTAFYDTRTNKLKVHNGAAFREAAYGGEVTSAYSENSDIGSPRFYGARIRTLFLTDEFGDPQPVLAMSYVKNTSGTGASANRGTTLVGEQYETIMALYSDSAFNVASDTNTPVDGDLINFQPELVGTDGIATSRPGRAAGQILKGVNTRAEYEQETSSIFNTVYVLGQLGGPDPVGSNVSPRVPLAYFQEVDIGNLLTVSSLDVTNDVDVGGEIIVTGNVESESTITCANLIVSANTILGSPNGVTRINGDLFVNGVSTQTIGAEGNVIENYYGDMITTANIDVSDTANINNLNVTNLTASADALFQSNVEVEGNTVLVDTETHDLHVTGNADIDGTLNVDGHSDIRGTTTFYSDVTLNTGTNLSLTSGNVTANYFVGIATSAQYADLAEVYVPDADYQPGTVVKLGGSAEITQTISHNDVDVFGVISTAPAYLMNSSVDGLPVAMTGRLPVKVVGKVNKGERLVSSHIPGVATALGDTEYDTRSVIGRSLEQKDTLEEGVVEAVIGVK